MTFRSEGRQKEGKVIWIEQLPFLPTKALAQAQATLDPRAPISAPVLGTLPSHDYVHLVFDHAGSAALRKLWKKILWVGGEASAISAIGQVPYVHGDKEQGGQCEP